MRQNGCEINREQQPELAVLRESANQLLDVSEIKENCVWKIKIMFASLKMCSRRYRVSLDEQLSCV